ncbi:uncharacterized protein LOC121735083 [Aricia agestis]|uniref:uncharacterized protein LOC121735083 n=1 Tax=Aricia agestis TaxID=91739 RepID=UPI001C20840A|nr:uncharacterized protein LOC121735083 [Aricia agestis]
MAPSKFGLFKSKSREQSEQPSTENLLKTSQSTEFDTPGSPIPSTSKGIIGEQTVVNMSVLSLDSDDEISSVNNSRRGSQDSKADLQVYQQFQNVSDVTSTCTLDDVDLNSIQEFDDTAVVDDDASTSYDVNSIQYDESSIAPSEDISIYCAMLKKPKKGRSKEQKLKDFDMWTASNFEVMQNLLQRSGTLDEQIKWEAIATSRGLCTLTDCCTCPDCTRAKYLSGVTDGDGGLGTAPLFSAINVGCQIQ